MKAITKYQAKDGAVFDTESDAIDHEKICDEIDAIMLALPPRPDNDECRFVNGQGYIQHKPEVFWVVRANLLKVASRFTDHEWIKKSIADSSVHPSFAHRIIGEFSSPLSTAWYRIMCVDKNLREWGQPYFADNNDKIHPKYQFQINV